MVRSTICYHLLLLLLRYWKLYAWVESHVWLEVVIRLMFCFANLQPSVKGSLTNTGDIFSAVETVRCYKGITVLIYQYTLLVNFFSFCIIYVTEAPSYMAHQHGWHENGICCYGNRHLRVPGTSDRGLPILQNVGLEDIYIVWWIGTKRKINLS